MKEAFITISEALKTAGIKHTISLDGSSITVTVEDDYLTALAKRPDAEHRVQGNVNNKWQREALERREA